MLKSIDLIVFFTLSVYHKQAAKTSKNTAKSPVLCAFCVPEKGVKNAFVMGLLRRAMNEKAAKKERFPALVLPVIRF